MSNYDIILCGPIIGIPDYRERFAIALVNVRRKHIQEGTKRQKIWNPAVLQEDMPKEWYIIQSFNAIFSSPNATLVMLKGWELDSKSKAEHALGLFLGRKVEEL